jgi:hypothetical protein
MLFCHRQASHSPKITTFGGKSGKNRRHKGILFLAKMTVLEWYTGLLMFPYILTEKRPRMAKWVNPVCKVIGDAKKWHHITFFLNAII